MARDKTGAQLTTYAAKTEGKMTTGKTFDKSQQGLKETGKPVKTLSPLAKVSHS